MMNQVVNSIDKLDDFLSFVAAYGPDGFMPRHKMDLQKAFSYISEGLDLCRDELGSDEKVLALKNLASQSKDLFENGFAADAAAALQEMSLLLNRR